jgi:hypothetical protein
MPFLYIILEFYPLLYYNLSSLNLIVTPSLNFIIDFFKVTLQEYLIIILLKQANNILYIILY